MYFLVPGQEPDPEQQAAMAAAAEREQMRLREFQHGHQRLFDELDEDQLTYLKVMLHIIVNNTGFPTAAAWEGAAAQALKTRFNICMTCGVNHDLEFTSEPSGGDEAATSTPAAPPTEVASPPEPSGKYSREDEPLLVEGAIGMNEDGTYKWSSSAAAAMDEYHLDDSYETIEDKVVGFKGLACTGIKGSNGPCGMVYPSIADRMLKEPEECSGCFRRNAHG